MIFRLRLGGQVGAFAMNQCADVQSWGRQDGGREGMPGPQEEKIKKSADLQAHQIHSHSRE